MTKSREKFFAHWRSTSSQRGAGLIEVLLATLVVGLTMTSVAAVMTLSIQSSGQNRLRAIAVTRAQEGIETFRRYRDELGWLAFTAKFANGTTVYCLDPLPTSAGEFTALSSGACDQGESIVGTEFIREVEVTPIGSSPVTAVQIRVNVNWFDGDDPKQVELFQQLTDY